MANHRLMTIPPAQVDGPGNEQFPFDFFAKRYLAQGDSWFSIGAFPPGLTTNILAEMELARSAVAVNCARPGKVLQHMTDTTREDAFVDLLAGTVAMRFDAILISGGGNDMIDAASIGPQANADQRLLATPAERGNVAAPEGYLSEPGWNTFATHLGQVFNDLVDLRDSRATNRQVPMVFHTYAYLMPRPVGAGLDMGPWLAPALTAFEVPAADWQAVAAALIDRLATLLQSLIGARRAADPACNLHLVDTRGAGLVLSDPADPGPSGDWVNEIHPTRGGYDKLAAVWRQTLDQLP